MTKDELLAAISDDRARLERALLSLDDVAIAAAPRGGWSVKDHLSHMAAWERMIVAHLRDGSDAAVAGMDGAAYAAASLDELNDRLYRLHCDDSVAAVRLEFRNAHAAIVAFIAAMPEQRLSEPYWDDDPSGRTVLEKIAGDTYLHYREHAEWIGELIAAATEPR
jgi:hypothetical protein